MTSARLRTPILALGGLGALLLLVAEFTDLYVIRSRGDTVAAGTAGAHHGYALLVIALAALALTGLATRAAAPRVIGLALLVLGLAALFVVIAIDLPDLGEEGVYGTITDPATSKAGIGFFLESAGAVLVTLAGGLTVAGPRG